MSPLTDHGYRGAPATSLSPAVENNNEAGFWESRNIADFNDDILRSAGSSWDDWQRFNPNWVRSPIADSFVRRGVELLRKNFEHSSFFALKDPRICRLLPFWLQTLTAFDAEPHCLIPIRNPLDVAASLRSRDDFSVPRSLALWLRHVLDAEHETRSLRRVILSYDDLLTDWRTEIGRIADQLEIHWPRMSTTAEMEIDTFLEQRHRHHHQAKIQALDTNPYIFDWIRGTYKSLNLKTADERRLNSGKTMTQSRPRGHPPGEASIEDNLLNYLR